MQHVASAQNSLEAPHHAWQGRTTWRILATDFAHGEDFLQTWADWQADAQRSQHLHFVAIVDSVTASAVVAHAPKALHAHAHALAARLYGLLPGVHRLSFEQGRVLLTLWVGEVHTMLRQQHCMADAVLLHPPFSADVYSIKALVRHCQRGSVLTMAQSGTLSAEQQQALQKSGFVFNPTARLLTAHFAPRWEPRQRAADTVPIARPSTAVVVGAGLAGAAIAHSLALRGWHVTVLAAGEAPADGASGLPAGLFCPHVSPDDSVLSRLSRSGVRMTLQRLRDVCQENQDWGFTGVLEHGIDGSTGLPNSWAEGPGQQWSQAACNAQLEAAGLPPSTSATWHAQAGWVRPVQLVNAQLAHPNIRFMAHTKIASVQTSEAGTWQAVDPLGHVVAHADLAFLACGTATASLLPEDVEWQLQALRGQITWGWHTADNTSALPPFSVNGSGNLVTHVPQESGHRTGKIWVMGSTFERDVEQLPISSADQMGAHAVNFDKLSVLLPRTATALRPWFTPNDEHCQPTWGHVRCASHDRLPIAGPVSSTTPGLWAITALGARGLTLSVLCAELIAAQLHGEPLPLDAKLALHLGTARLAR